MKLPLYLMLFKTFHALRNASRKDMARYDLSPGQPKMMRYIESHPGCSLSTLATNCDIENATASKTVNTLIQKEMVEKRINENNKRAYQLFLSEKGTHALSMWKEHCDEIENIALKDFSEEEKEIFKSLLKRMYKNITDKELS